MSNEVGSGAISDLFVDDPAARLAAAREFPGREATSRQPTLEELPAELRESASLLRGRLIGPVNAWCIFVGPSPGAPDPVRRLEYGPGYLPVLGRPHPYWRYPVRFFRTLRTWCTEAYRRGGVFETEAEALSVSGLTNLLGDNESDSRVLKSRLPAAVPAFWEIVRLTRARLVVALTRDVFEALRSDLPKGARAGETFTERVGTYSPNGVWIEGDDRLLLARVPNHPNRPHPREETLDYLARVVGRVLSDSGVPHRPRPQADRDRAIASPPSVTPRQNRKASPQSAAPTPASSAGGASRDQLARAAHALARSLPYVTDLNPIQQNGSVRGQIAGEFWFSIHPRVRTGSYLVHLGRLGLSPDQHAAWSERNADRLRGLVKPAGRGGSSRTHVIVEPADVDQLREALDRLAGLAG